MQLVIPSLQMIAAICLSAQYNSADGPFYAMYIHSVQMSKSIAFSVILFFPLFLPTKHLQFFPQTLLKNSDVNSMDVHFISIENSSQQGLLNLCFVSACTFSCCMWSLHKKAFS